MNGKNIFCVVFIFFSAFVTNVPKETNVNAGLINNVLIIQACQRDRVSANA